MNVQTTIDPQLMKVGDQAFWEEFNQRDNPGERYIVIDSKQQQIVGENLQLVREMKKVKADWYLGSCTSQTLLKLQFCNL